MASITYILAVRDSTIATGDNRKTGLLPVWVFLKKTSDNSDLTPPAIAEVGFGQYKFSYDPEALGEAAGQVDMGNTLSNGSDRYLDVQLTLDSSRIQRALPDEAVASATSALILADPNHKITTDSSGRVTATNGLNIV